MVEGVEVEGMVDEGRVSEVRSQRLSWGQRVLSP